jgi:predicted TIM-barrel fold metal-dependent hydrolase
VVLIESGVTWRDLATRLHVALGQDQGGRGEVPWVTQPPAALVREHVRLTVQPIDAPADPAQLGRIIDQLGSDDMLLFSTDYPHWQFDGDQVLAPGLPARLQQRVLLDNPLQTFRRLREVSP